MDPELTNADRAAMLHEAIAKAQTTDEADQLRHELWLLAQRIFNEPKQVKPAVNGQPTGKSHHQSNSNGLLYQQPDWDERGWEAAWGRPGALDGKSTEDAP